MVNHDTRKEGSVNSSEPLPDSYRVEEYLAAYLPFARRRARILGRGDEHLEDDLIQEGLIGLYRGLAFYDPRRGNLEGFAKTCMMNAMLSFLRKRERPRKLEEKLRALRFSQETSSMEERLEDREFLDVLIEILSPLETAVLDAVFATGTPKLAAELLDWPIKKVENALHRMRKKAGGIKKDLDREGRTP
jgi:RNA polymerase sigma factor (sigma-70 family)